MSKMKSTIRARVLPPPAVLLDSEGCRKKGLHVFPSVFLHYFLPLAVTPACISLRKIATACFFIWSRAPVGDSVLLRGTLLASLRQRPPACRLKPRCGVLTCLLAAILFIFVFNLQTKLINCQWSWVSQANQWGLGHLMRFMIVSQLTFGEVPDPSFRFQTVN